MRAFIASIAQPALFVLFLPLVLLWWAWKLAFMIHCGWMVMLYRSWRRTAEKLP